MIGSGLMGVIGALAVTLGMLALAVYLLRRMQSGQSFGGKGVPLQILKRIPVGPKQGVALLRVADRVLVVSIAETGTSLLTELGDQALVESLKSPPGEPGGRQNGGFQFPIIGRFALIAALALACTLASAPRAARAQGMTSPAPAPGRVSAVSTQVIPPHGPSVTPPLPPKVEIQLGQGNDALKLSGAVGLVVFMGVLTLLPAIFLLMTSFTRILIVLHFLRSALGTQTAPPGQLLVAFSVLLTGLVMSPVLQKTNQVAVQPYMNGRITQADAYKLGIQPFREFMLSNTRNQDLTTFTRLSGASNAASMEEVPTITLVSAFVTSELRTAFQMGFVIYLPFVVVDVIVASVLMSLGMFMLPPAMISLPFKLLLFVLADGWSLVVQNLVASFR